MDDRVVPGHLSEDEQVALLDAATGLLAALAADATGVGSSGVDRLMAAAGALGAALDGARVSLTAEAAERGLVGESGAASPTDWVLARSRALAPGEARCIAEVASAGRERAVRPVAEAVRSGDLTARTARVVLREYACLRPQLVPDAAPAVLGGLVEMGAAHGPRGVRDLRTLLVAEHGAAGTLDREQATLARMRALSSGSEDGSGMRDYVLRLDPEGAQVLEAALTPLAAPQPADGAPDLRSSHQRRADALVELVGRAVASAEHVPTTPRAVLVVTIDHEHLRAATGAATTADGSLVAPGSARRLACEAGVLPVVLGSQGEPLDVGRERRLVTPRLLRALWLRDGGCTFPGCSRPPGWCQAHHVRHWADGGPTDLGNLALVCQRHHTHVHQHGLTASVTASGVTWRTGGPGRRAGPRPRGQGARGDEEGGGPGGGDPGGGDPGGGGPGRGGPGGGGPGGGGPGPGETLGGEAA